MSLMLYLASNVFLDTVKNPHYRTLSVNEAMEMGMSVPEDLLAPGIDRDEPGVLLWSDISIVIDTDKGTVDDGNFDDDFSIYSPEPEFDPSGHSKPFRVVIECRMTEGRAKRILDYIRGQLEKTGEIQLWSVLLSDDDQKTVWYDARIDELTPEDLLEIEKLPCREEPPKMHCVRIRK